MEKETIQSRALKIQNDILDKWKTLNYNGQENYGFRVFYGTISQNPELMIISLNPGIKGNFETDLEKYKMSELPSEIPYQGDRPFPTEIRKLFGDDQKMLSNSVIISLFPFRSKTYKDLKLILKSNRGLKEFCYEKAMEMVTQIAPKRILVIGVGTINKLNKYVFGKDSYKVEKIMPENYDKHNQRRIIYSNYESIPVFSVAHLTGAHINKEDRQEMYRCFKNWIEEN